MYTLYTLSLIVTWMFYPAQPVYDLETDEIVGHYTGLTWFHFFMYVPFTGINYWCYTQINKSNSMGIKPGFCLDLFGVNIAAMSVYCVSNQGLQLFWIVPIYGVYKIAVLIQTYCCSKGYSDLLPDEEPTKSKTQQKKEKNEGKQKVKYQKVK